MDLDAPALTWMPLSPRRPAVTLIFDLQNLTISRS